MKRLVGFVFFIASALGVFAIAPDRICCDTLPDNLSRVYFHTAFSASQRSALRASVLWNCIDSTAHGRADIEMSRIIHEARGPYRVLSWKMVKRAAGRDSVLFSEETEVPVNSGSKALLSAVFGVSGVKAEMVLTTANTTRSFAVPYDSVGASVFATATSPETAVASQVILYALGNACEEVSPATLEILGDNPVAPAGYWRYLDRNIDPRKASLPRFFDLVVLPAGDGTYTVLSRDKDEARTLRFKGVLKRTIFVDHFDLQWYDNTGKCRTTEDYADVILQGSVLQLNFPLLNSCIRFSRDIEATKRD